MESAKLEAAFLEEAVCNSETKELRLHCHAKSGRGWVEVNGRRYVGNGYVQAARHLQATERLHVKHQGEDHTVYELGEHACVKA